MGAIAIVAVVAIIIGAILLPVMMKEWEEARADRMWAQVQLAEANNRAMLYHSQAIFPFFVAFLMFMGAVLLVWMVTHRRQQQAPAQPPQIILIAPPDYNRGRVLEAISPHMQLEPSTQLTVVRREQPVVYKEDEWGYGA